MAYYPLTHITRLESGDHLSQSTKHPPYRPPRIFSSPWARIAHCSTDTIESWPDWVIRQVHQLRERLSVPVSDAENKSPELVTKRLLLVMVLKRMCTHLMISVMPLGPVLSA